MIPKAKSSSDIPIDRINILGYGPKDTRKTSFAATAPNPLFIVTETAALLTLRWFAKRGKNIPYVETTTPSEIIEIARDPRQALSQQWKDYAVGTLVVDTMTTLDTEYLNQLEAASDYKDEKFWGKHRHQLMMIAAALARSQCNSIMLGHPQEGREEVRDKTGRVRMKQRGPGPAFTGQLLRILPQFVDFTLYFYKHPAASGGFDFYMSTVDMPNGMPAGVKGVNMDMRIKAPTFDSVLEALKAAS